MLGLFLAENIAPHVERMGVVALPLPCGFQSLTIFLNVNLLEIPLAIVDIVFEFLDEILYLQVRSHLCSSRVAHVRRAWGRDAPWHQFYQFHFSGVSGGSDLSCHVICRSICRYLGGHLGRRSSTACAIRR